MNAGWAHGVKILIMELKKSIGLSGTLSSAGSVSNISTIVHPPTPAQLLTNNFGQQQYANHQQYS